MVCVHSKIWFPKMALRVGVVARSGEPPDYRRTRATYCSIRSIMVDAPLGAPARSAPRPCPRAACTHRGRPTSARPGSWCDHPSQRTRQMAGCGLRCGTRIRGRPVLIGTRSVAASETISSLLSKRGTAHVVLNARQDSAEADTVAQAGQSYPACAGDRGGLHVRCPGDPSPTVTLICCTSVLPPGNLTSNVRTSTPT
jgi:hypothetical protein